MDKPDFKYIGYMFVDPDKCIPIMEKTLKAVQNTIDIELNSQEFTDTNSMEDLHCVVYEVKKEIKISEKHKLNFKIEV